MLDVQAADELCLNCGSSGSHDGAPEVPIDAQTS
jgi:hypothetical protein